jgi:RNA polymerase sigma-70 factor (ECF subfamily)
VVDESAGVREALSGVDASEKSQILRDAVARLSPEQRKVVELAFFGGFTQSEIAERLGEPLGTVKARARRGLMKLKEILGPQI